ncbi:MAG: cupredoxin domain-containing protein [Parvibaculum sp.]|nr:cupredoxin domain-containing protein [Parvibaculum sp.]
MKRMILVTAGVLALFASGMSVASADDVPTFEITIKDHKFDPEKFDVPAGKDFKLIVKNLDATPEEFESFDFPVEKIIAGGGEGVFNVEALDAGDYKFFGEFNMDTANGVITAK